MLDELSEGNLFVELPSFQEKCWVFPPFSLGLELESQQSMEAWNGLLEIIRSHFLLQNLDLFIQDITKLSLIFFFQQEDSTISLSILFQSPVALTEYFPSYIHLYFLLQQLVPITSVL